MLLESAAILKALGALYKHPHWQLDCHVVELPAISVTYYNKYDYVHCILTEPHALVIIKLLLRFDIEYYFEIFLSLWQGLPSLLSRLCTFSSNGVIQGVLADSPG